MATEDEDLLTRAVQGEKDALSELLQRFGPQVRTTLHGRISPAFQSVLDADDVMQVTYIDAFVNIVTFQPKGIPAFVSWLGHVATNNLRDAIKGLEADKRPDPHKQVAPPRGDGTYVALYDVITIAGGTPSRVVGGQEAQRLISAVIEKLPRDYKLVVQRVDIEGRPVSEVAAEMKRTVGAVYMLRARAHDLMREWLPSTSHFFSQ